MLKFTELPKTPGMTSLKNIAVSQVHMMAEQNVKKQYVPHVLDPNQIVQTTCSSKLKFT